MKNSFIKNYEAFEGKVFIGYVYIYFDRKSNLGCEINCQGRYLHEVGK